MNYTCLHYIRYYMTEVMLSVVQKIAYAFVNTSQTCNGWSQGNLLANLAASQSCQDDGTIAVLPFQTVYVLFHLSPLASPLRQLEPGMHDELNKRCDVKNLSE